MSDISNSLEKMDPETKVKLEKYKYGKLRIKTDEIAIGNIHYPKKVLKEEMEKIAKKYEERGKLGHPELYIHDADIMKLIYKTSISNGALNGKSN